MRFDIGKRDNDNVVLNKGQEAAVTNLIDFIAAPFDARIIFKHYAVLVV